MEQEIDLRPYLQAIFRQWWLIVASMVVLGVVAAVWTTSSPRQAQARGDLLLVAQSTQLSLDPRFTERDSSMLTNAVNQRQALLDLASSSALEARVAQALGLSSYHDGELLAKIKVTATSDLLRIGATAATDEEALRLAETWTHSYEALVNELYSGTGAATQSLEIQLTSAQQRYDEIQTALTAFYATGELVQANQQVKRLEGLLQGGTDAQIRLYNGYLVRAQDLNLILEDARALQAQNETGVAPDLAASLTALVVRTRLAGGGLPVQLNFGSAESFAQGQATTTDLPRFLTVLAGQRDRMVAQANTLAHDLAAGDGSAVGLPPDLRARYEADLATARGALARATGNESALLQRREVALSSLKVLQSKRDEGQIAQAASAVSVRFVGVATVAAKSLASSLGLNLVVAALIGFFLATGWIVGREFVRHLSSGREPAGSASPPRD